MIIFLDINQILINRKMCSQYVMEKHEAQLFLIQVLLIIVEYLLDNVNLTLLYYHRLSSLLENGPYMMSKSSPNS